MVLYSDFFDQGAKIKRKDFARDWLQQKMLYLVLMDFIVDLAPKWLREKTFYYTVLNFIVLLRVRRDYGREQIFYFIFLFSIDFARHWLWSRYLKFFNCIL